ncbi:glucose-1-phosphate adenylyltransferase [Cyanobium sp. Cruz CV13-4-11]|jgi:glucose-1-phosphate adenylyltransferase|uniref:glucose-1-phosphate adenylyltransferase n=1 Tax=unclassified Cyanobium TaxID=2627006 RepID=UPI0020CCCDEE|nr:MULTISPECIES: glucose-1-phosphate adenylyltransferase [unclassified Cyanobium]MCP9901339.1 glucose-1-phosphate adenylyltransferase [Cyanobium sp. Cruz CV11-17]MCP9919195.1 glucose-1-phosphate adenylyltransferase [Cyanobium sp. Cruz CV13-4-11]
MNRVLAIILGGGAGTRLQPLTLTRAKPAVPLGGKYRLIDIPISNCINSGILKIYALTQFNSQSLNRHLSLTYNLSSGFSSGFVEVLAAQQTLDSPSWFEGTADAVRQYRELFEAWDVDQVLILSGDQLYRMDYAAFVAAHRASGAAVTMAALPVDSAAAEGFGLMRTDAEGRIREFREKPRGEALEAMRVDTGALGLSASEAERRPFLASMGIYVFERDILFNLLASHPQATDFGQDIIPAALASDLPLQSYLFDAYWEDIGTIKAFYDANLALADEQPAFSFYDEQAPIYTRSRYLPPSQIRDSRLHRSVLSEGCLLDRCVIEHCVLGLRLRVEEGAVLEDTLVMGADAYESEAERALVRSRGGVPLGIGAESVVKRAILDKNVRIGANVQVINKDRVQEADRSELGVTIRSGIVVIEKNTTVADGTVI